MALVRRGTLIGIFVACVLLAAGCGGSSDATASEEAVSADPGREVIEAFVSAAAAEDAHGMWNLLSAPSRRRYGPTLADFRAGEAKTLSRTLTPFSTGKLPVEVSENIDDLFGVVALSRGGHAFATPLRREADAWRVELPGPLKIDISGPPPGSKGKFVDQVAVEVVGRTGPGTAVLYMDGVTLDPKIYSGQTSATVYSSFPNGLEPGSHTVVAFATSGDSAAATAWTFWP
jgi:hypothetical protein